MLTPTRTLTVTLGLSITQACAYSVSLTRYSDFHIQSRTYLVSPAILQLTWPRTRQIQLVNTQLPITDKKASRVHFQDSEKGKNCQESARDVPARRKQEADGIKESLSRLEAWKLTWQKYEVKRERDRPDVRGFHKQALVKITCILLLQAMRVGLLAAMGALDWRGSYQNRTTFLQEHP
jgi:hypothetical protein